MQSIIDHFQKIESEAKKIGLTISDICAETEPSVDRSTLMRWKTGYCAPRMQKWEAFCEAYERLKTGKIKRKKKRFKI